MDDRLLSPRDAARALGASESSLKRWVDAGELAARRTMGGHRRIPASEVLRFARAQGIVPRDPAPLGRAAAGPSRAVRTAIARALRAGDASALERALLQAHLDGVPVHALADGPLRESLAGIGDRWRDGAAAIAAEHAATMLIVRALGALRQALPAPQMAAPVAVGGGAGGDPYVLPTLLASLVLQEAGWRTIDLGPDTPDDALVVAARAARAALVWRSCSGEADAGRQARALRGLCAELAPVPVAAGGRALAGIDETVAANLTILRDMGGLDALARRIAGGS